MKNIKILPTVCKNIFSDINKSTFDDENESNKKSLVHVIICTKTIKTIFEANEKIQDEFGDINCLKDTQNSASRLLKKCIGSNMI